MDDSKLNKDLEELGFQKHHIDLATKFSTNLDEIVEMIVKMIEDPSYEQQLKSDLYILNQNMNFYNDSNKNVFPEIPQSEENHKMVISILFKVILVRTDLKMRTGKIAAQVGHAVLKAYKKAINTHQKELEDWEAYGQAKIVLGVDNLEKLSSFYEKAKKLGVNCCTIKDAGRTQVEPGTLTCCAIGPGRVSVIDNITGSLSLL